LVLPGNLGKVDLLSQLQGYQTAAVSERLNRLKQPARPHGVQLALDYIESHLERPLTLGDLVSESGVPVALC
jgi:hypothetical protein